MAIDPSDAERVLKELNEAIAEEALESQPPEGDTHLPDDRRRNERRAVVPDRRLGDRRTSA